ncbi:MAG: MATE family efflux transporter [Desulfobacteraceae bacterium]|nr:MAG: MATE family efflux transporter [Desulfobacteraceae bacterium]
MKSSTRIDLTKGSIPKLLLRLSGPIVFSMLMFTLYLMVDLYFVGRLGPDAVAAVSISGNAFFVILGLSFILGIGGMALIAQAFGRRDYKEAAKIYKQSIILTIVVGIVASLTGLAIASPYIDFFGGVGQSLAWGIEYFQIFSISFFFVLLLHVIGSCYRGMGDTRTPMFIMVLSTALNIILDPLLIFGLLGFPRLGVRGAAIASLSSQLISTGIYFYLIFLKGHHLKIKGPWQLDRGIIKKSLAIGLPSGLTYFLLALNMLITYRVVSVFGTPALASLGIGFRILQAIYLPVIAVTSAMAAMVGQNFGARKQSRITRTLWTGLAISSGVMVLGTVLCRMFPESLIGIFSNDKAVIHYGVIYLAIMSLGNVIVGTIMTMSAVFQGFGKTYPNLIAAVFDNALFAALVFTLPGLFGWGIQAVWWIKLATAGIEMVIIATWLRRHFRGIRS